MQQSIETNHHWAITVVYLDDIGDGDSVSLEIRRWNEPDSDPIANVELSPEQRIVLAGALLVRIGRGDGDQVFNH